MSDDFGPFDGHVWLNAASEGPLPKAAAAAVEEAVRWKLNPAHLTLRRFREVPRLLKSSLGRLFDIHADEVILSNSASYGWDLIARGLDWKRGDEVVVMENDFPVNILPWMGLLHRGVRVHQIKTKGWMATVDEVSANLTARTRLVCLSHVHTFSGHRLDVGGMSELCRDRDVVFCLNITQSAGTEPLDADGLGADAVTSSGFKWLLGPYGTGFCWFAAPLRERLRESPNFWGNVLAECDLLQEGPLTPPAAEGTGRFDVFGTANFFNFVPWRVSIDYLNEIGLDQVRRHNQSLIQRLLDGVKHTSLRPLSPADPKTRSNLVVLTHEEPERNPFVHQMLKAARIHTALWKNRIRISPHIHNTAHDIDRCLEILKRA